MSKLNGEKLLNELMIKWRGKTCPFCGGNWVISEKIFELREFQNGDVVLGGIIQPVVSITCESCGNTVLVNPLVLNVMED